MVRRSFRQASKTPAPSLTCSQDKGRSNEQEITEHTGDTCDKTVNPQAVRKTAASLCTFTSDLNKTPLISLFYYIAFFLNTHRLVGN